MKQADEEMQDIMDAMVVDETAEAAGAAETAGRAVAGTAAGDVEVTGRVAGDVETAGRAAAGTAAGDVETAEAADDPDGWVTYDEAGGITFRRLGKAAKRAMIVALPGEALEHTKLSEMTAIAAIPSGYQIIEAVLPMEKAAGAAQGTEASRQAREPESGAPHYTPESIEASERYLTTLFDKISREGFANVYLLAYDTAVPVCIRGLRHKEIKRAYFISPDFKLNGEPVREPWKVETEILRGSRDADVPEKEVRHFMKNSRSHMSKIDMGHRMVEDDQFAAFGRWLTGARSNRYNDNGFIMMMAVGLFVGFLAGWLIFRNSTIGLIMGAACGLIFYQIYKKI